jgi:predicted amidohydrolase
MILMRCAIAFLTAALLAVVPALAADPPRRLRVAGAQLPVTEDVAANLAALERAVAYAAAQKADVLLTPEGSLSGYFTEFDAARTAAALARITAAARNAGVALALGTCFREPKDGRRYDELRFYDKQGRYLGFHAKILLCRHIPDAGSKGEIGVFATRPLRTFELQGIPIGGLVCNDMWANPEWTPEADPHLSQQLAEKGARVIFHAVNSGLAQSDSLLELNRHYHDSNLRLRARAGKLWIVVVDAGDPQGKLANHAPSGVIDPAGNWKVRVDEPGERFFVYTIELN